MEEGKCVTCRNLLSETIVPIKGNSNFAMCSYCKTCYSIHAIIDPNTNQQRFDEWGRAMWYFKPINQIVYSETNFTKEKDAIRDSKSVNEFLDNLKE